MGESQNWTLFCNAYCWDIILHDIVMENATFRSIHGILLNITQTVSSWNRPVMLENILFQVIPNLVIPCVRKVSTVRRELVVTGLGARKEHSAMSLDWTTSPTANNALAGITVMSQIWPPQLHSATLGISVLKGLILPSQTVQPTQEMVVFVRWVLNVHKAV